ncbi:WD40-repeat-containing domain protein [Mycena pura]|uniref:WD40-repeat-containing domain protein n=1 Tax=Mycena pura TaxID=153505 RepID=A0AAD6V734_9AGAR|nr:WD40-repeat-containing domain protein [Mycena pura]
MSSTSSSGPRRSKRLREDDLERYSNIKNPPSFPHLQLFIQSGDNLEPTPIDSNDLAYAEHRQIITVVLAHLVRSPIANGVLTTIFNDIARKRVSEYKNEEIVVVDEYKIAAFLKDQTPRIIFQKLEPTDTRDVIWGKVNKGNEPRAEENELYVSMDLANILRSEPPPPDVESHEIERQRRIHRLLFHIVVMHELIHCMSKHFFGSEYLTPALNSSLYRMVRDGKGNGESGWTFERKYVGFQLEVWFIKEDIALGDWLWHVSSLVATHLPGSSQSYVLNDRHIDNLVLSFRKMWLYEICPSKLRPVPLNTNSDTHVRCRTGSAVPTAEDSSDDSSDDSLEAPQRFISNDYLISTFMVRKSLSRLWRRRARFLAGTADGRVVEYTTASGEAMSVLGPGHTSIVVGLAAGSSGKVFSAGYDDRVREIGAGGPSASFSDASIATASQPKSIASSTDGDGTVFVVESGSGVEAIRNNQKVAHLQATNFTPSTVGVSAGGKLVAIGGEDHKVRLYEWSGTAFTEVRLLEGNKAVISAIEFSPDGALLAAGDSSGRVVLFDLKEEKLITSRWSFHSARVNSLAWTADSKVDLLQC